VGLRSRPARPGSSPVRSSRRARRRHGHATPLVGGETNAARTAITHHKTGRPEKLDRNPSLARRGEPAGQSSSSASIARLARALRRALKLEPACKQLAASRSPARKLMQINSGRPRRGPAGAPKREATLAETGGRRGDCGWKHGRPGRQPYASDPISCSTSARSCPARGAGGCCCGAVVVRVRFVMSARCTGGRIVYRETHCIKQETYQQQEVVLLFMRARGGGARTPARSVLVS
jgi:hypothetical protein